VKERHFFCDQSDVNSRCHKNVIVAAYSWPHPRLLLVAEAENYCRKRQYESAHIAQKLVMWYTGRMWTLWVLLLGLPFTELVSGRGALLRSWNREIVLPLTARQSLAMVRAHLATLFIAATTLIAGVILAIVVLHVLAN